MHLGAVSYITELTDPPWDNDAATMPMDCRRSRCACVRSALRFLACVELRVVAIRRLFGWLATSQLVPINARCISVVSPVTVIDGRGLVVEGVEDPASPLEWAISISLDELGDGMHGARTVPERQIKKLKNLIQNVRSSMGSLVCFPVPVSL